MCLTIATVAAMNNSLPMPLTVKKCCDHYHCHRMQLTLAALVALAMPHCHSHILKMSNPIMGLYILYIDMYLCGYISIYVHLYK